VRRKRRRPETPQQRQLQCLWAKVLDRDPDHIGIDDNFMRIGGDSIKAMKLVGAARDQGFSLTVAEVFSHPRLRDLARFLNSNTLDSEVAVPPFALLGAKVDQNDAIRKAASLCNVSHEQIKDIFGCTSLQEGLLAMTARRLGDYVA
jgi:aryl carrier-like protein